jgi:hypothetical protein
MEELPAGIEELGLRSEFLGPRAEWSPVSIKTYQRRHGAFWGIVDCMIRSVPGEYEDLPDWMTEIASDQLTDN